VAYFVDSMGRLVEADVAHPEDLTELQRQGYAPATQRDLDQHDQAEAVKAADEGGFSGRAALESGQRMVGRAAGLIGDATGLSAPVPAGLEGEGTSSAEQAFPDAFGDEARLRAEAHPFSAMAGQLATATPVALAGGALAAGAVGAGLAGTAAAIGTEAAIEAVAQEGENAWLEERPAELKNVATYTGMFALGDVLFRGVGKGLSSIFGGGSRNIVSEANEVLRKKAGPIGERPGSVGAARASDLDDAFEPAIKEMSDRDAVILDRDSDDYYKLISTHSADSFTRLYRGLDEDLGNAVKYQDFEKGAKEWDAGTETLQAKWFVDLEEKGARVAEELRRKPKGDIDAIDYGNAGKVALKTIDDYTRQIANSPNSARRNYLADNFKRDLQKQVVKIDASFGIDNPTRAALKDLIEPLQEDIRTGLMDPVKFGRNAHLNKELNAGWTQLLKSWRKVEETFLDKTGETLYNHAGAGRIVKEGTTRKALSALSEDPRLNVELQRHLAKAYDGLTNMVEARQRWGLSRMDNLDNLAGDIRSLKEDWNLASTIGVAKNKAAHARRDPQKWANLIADIGSQAPVVGGAVSAARNLGRIAEGTRLTAGTRLADVWDRGLSRYAKHPDLAEASISRNYSEWMQNALREHGGKVAAGALFAGAAAAPDDESGAMGASAGALALLAGRGGRKVARRLSGYKTEREISKELSETGKEHLYTLLRDAKVPVRNGRMEREFDASRLGVTADGRPFAINDKGYAQGTARYEYQASIDTPKVKPAIDDAATELAMARVDRKAGFSKVTHGGLDTIPTNSKALISLARKTGADIKALQPDEQLALLDYIEGGGAAAFRALQQGTPIPGKERFADSLEAFESATEKLMRSGLTESVGPLWRGLSLRPEDATRLVNAQTVETGELTSTSFDAFYAKDMFADTARAREMGHVPVVLKFEKVERASPLSAAGFSKQYGSSEREALLPPGATFEVVDVARSESKLFGHIEVTLRAAPKGAAPVGFVLSGLLGLGAALAPGDESGAMGASAGALALLAGRGGRKAAAKAAGKQSPVDLTGKSLRDLGALDDPGSFKPETLEALRTGKGGRGDFARDFGATGRVDQAGQVEQGIQIEMGPKGPLLRDGRHRLMVAREQGRATVYGQVFNGKRAPGKKPIYEGEIPIAEASLGGVIPTDAASARALLQPSKKLPSQAVDIERAVGGAKEDLAPFTGRQAPSPVPSRGGLPSKLPPITNDVFTPHVGSVAHDGILSERLSGRLGKTEGGFFRGKDGKIRYVKADADPIHNAIEVGNARMYRALGVGTPEWVEIDLPNIKHEMVTPGPEWGSMEPFTPSDTPGIKAMASEWLGPEWRELNAVEDWSTLPQSVRDSYARTVPKDIILGNWDVQLNARNVMTDGKTTLMVDAGEAGANSPFANDYEQTSAAIQRTVSQGKGRGNVNTAKNMFKQVGSVAPHELLASYAPNKGQLRSVVQQGFDEAVAVIDGMGGPEGFIRAHHPSLSPEAVKRQAEAMQQRIIAVKGIIPILSTALFLSFGGDAQAAEEPPRPPPDALPPEVAYSRAMVENARGGRAEIAAAVAELVGTRRPNRSDSKLREDVPLTAEAALALGKTLDELIADPRALIERVAASTGELSRTHPSVYGALVQQAAQMVAYLSSVRPQPVARSMSRPDGLPPTHDELLDWSARVRGTTQPRATIKAIGRGTAPPPAVEAFAATWQPLWNEVRVGVAGVVTRMAEDGGGLDPERLSYLDRTLAFDGALDGMQSPAMTGHILAAIDQQAAADQAARETGGGNSGGGGSSSTRLATRLGSIAAERSM